MGATVLILLEKAERERNKRTNSNSKILLKGRNGGNGVYSPNIMKLTLPEYIEYLSKENPKLKKFFETLKQYEEQIDREDAHDISIKMQEESQKYVEQKKKCDRCAEELENTGITLDHSIRSDMHYSGVEVSEGRGFSGHGKYSYNNKETFTVGFNGIRITSEMLRDPETNPYEADFLEWQNNNKDLDFKIEKLEQSIEDKERRLRLTLFNKEDKKQEIEEMKAELDILKASRQEGIDKKNKMETYANLTPGQKTKISEYLNQVKICEEIGDKIGYYVDKTIQVGRGERGKERKNFKRALERAKAEGKVSQEEIKEVNEILCEVNPTEEEYQVKYFSNSTTSTIAKWYYFEEMKGIRGKTKLEKLEEELSEKEKEETQISDVETAVAKVEELNDPTQSQEDK